MHLGFLQVGMLSGVSEKLQEEMELLKEAHTKELEGLREHLQLQPR
jgi:hypothetical protein